MNRQAAKGQTSNKRPPRLAEGLLRLLASRKNKTDLLGDIEEEYRYRRSQKGRLKADLWYISQIVFPIPFFMRTSVFWSFAILRNYTKVAVRSMRRHKAFTAINTAGLSLGMACFLLTVVWAQYEFSFDRFHKKAGSISRVISTQQQSTGPRLYAGAPLPLGQHLLDNYPEVVSFARFRQERFYWRLQIGDSIEYNTIRLAYTDPEFFEMFDFPLVEGNPSMALEDTSSMLISERLAATYFKNRSPIGEAVLVMDNKVPMHITGILKDVPENSHMQFDILVNIRAFEVLYDTDVSREMWDDWTSASFGLFVQLERGVSSEEFGTRISTLLNDFDPESKYTMSLQPLTKIHLHSASIGDYGRIGGGEISTIYLFLFISFMVLLIACINFMSLATARSLKRSKEVGIRKVSGAFRTDIVKQFMGESFLHVFGALALALILADLSLPLLRNLTGRALELDLLRVWPLVLSILGVTFLTGFLSGVYPAVFASACDPVQTLKDLGETRRYSFIFLRRVLVSVQFVCASVLIIVSLVILSQLQYLEKKDLGYDHRDVAVFSIGSVRKNLDAFRAELLKDPSILHVAAGAAPTWGTSGHRFGEGGQSRLSWEGKRDDDIVLMDMHFVDHDFLSTFQMEIKQGRWFSREFPTDKDNYVLNESAVKAIGISDPIGKWFKFGDDQGQIVGVVKDFHTSTLRSEIAPTFFVCSPNIHVMARVAPNDQQRALAHIEKTWKQFVPERPITLQWLDERLSNFYSDDRKLGSIVTNYTGLSLLISCLGLLGLVSFLAEHKTKEIGVRKVLGAPVGSVVSLMAKEYVVILALSSLIAWPIGYWVASRWLADFAYNTGLDVWIFPAAFVSVFVVAFLTVGYKTLKAALRNPIDSLRYE